MGEKVCVLEMILMKLKPSTLIIWQIKSTNSDKVLMVINIIIPA